MGFFIFYLFLFLIGLCVGSFLNAVIWRLEIGESVVLGTKFKFPREFLNMNAKLARSYCPHCKTELRWYDLIPILSFFILRGRCRYCNKKISIQYPLVEIGTALIFLLILNFKSAIFNGFLISQFLIFNLIDLIFWLYIASVLIAIFVYDLKHYIIPDKILVPAIVISFIYRIYEILILFLVPNAELVSSSYKTLKQIQCDGKWVTEVWQPLFLYILAAILASFFFLSIFIISRGRGMGFGDVKLAFLMGLILGWPNILVALFLAFLVGAVVGMGLIFIYQSKALRKFSFVGVRKYSFKSQIPFGPFLITGTFVALFGGQKIVEWYMRTLF